MSENISTNDQPKLYDTAMIDSIGRNNAAFTEKMIVMFVDMIIQDFDLLKAEAAKANFSEVSQIAHRMKSTFGNMAVNSVLSFIKDLELGSANPLLAIKQLDDELIRVIAQIKNDYPQLF